MEILESFTKTELLALEWDWRFHARPKQLPPDNDWMVWMLRAGRGFGKTRAGGGWFHERAMAYPYRWMALVSATPADARDYCIEGPGGLLRNTPPWERPLYEPSKRRLTWPNGSWAIIYSSEKPDALRGFSGDTAWLDEMLKYKNPQEVWDNLQFGMREPSSDQPRIAITSTPRPHPLLITLEEEDTTEVTVGSSYENRANLDPVWFKKVLSKYEGTKLGEQEIHAKILDDIEGRVYSSFSKAPFPEGNVDSSLPEVSDTTGPILIGQDFNVNPMASVIAVRAGDQCLVLEAMEVGTSNTEEVAAEYKRRWPNRRIIIFPDPSGRARKTSAPVGQTDFTILERAGFEVRAPKAAPPVVDRVNNSQAMFLQKENRRVRIHPRAKSLVQALGNLTYKEGTSIRDKAGGWDHVCDALDYLLWEEFNVMVELGRAKPFRWKV